MLKKAHMPVLLIAVVAGTAVIALMVHLTGFNAKLGRGDAVSPSRLTYDEARAKLLRGSRWHLTDSRFTAKCWVTQVPRPAEELEHVVIVHDSPNPKLDRHGVVRVQALQGRVTKIVGLNQDDTSDWHVVGDVLLAGDPALVAEVAAFLVTDSDP
jgi:hypothetical protein